MKKENILQSSKFHMDANDVLHLLFDQETGVLVTYSLNSINEDGDDNIEEVPDAPVAIAASDITASSFTANWNYMENTLGFYLDVAEDSAFTSMVAGYSNLDVGLINEYSVAGLDDTITYYYRLRGYNDYGTGISGNTITTTTANEAIVDADGNVYTYVTIGTQQWLVENLKTTKYADGTAIPNISNYNDWFLPSKDELNEMYTELHLNGIGDFIAYGYLSSSEASATNMWTQPFSTGITISFTKVAQYQVRACRAFTSVSTSYNLRDIGPAGGYIFWKSGNDYLEAAPSDQLATNGWSNITNVAIGTTGTAIGTGQANTAAIIAQAGHTDSAAKLCDDLTSDMLWAADTTGAYCYYDNDIANKAVYGALYNWYAVDNAHGLAPTGWRVPTIAEYDTLFSGLGGLLVAGGKLKEVGLTYWSAPNTGAVDEVGFSARGGGNRITDGSFGSKMAQGRFWTLIEDSATHGTVKSFEYSDGSASEGLSPKITGCSIRCMRDV